MKKVFFILLAVVFAAGTINAKKPKPNTIAVWDGKQVVYNQPLADMDSITFTTSSNLLTKAAICKRWTESYSNYYLELNSDYTFSFGDKDEQLCSGKYFLQGKLILLCITSEHTRHGVPSCVVYDDGKLYFYDSGPGSLIFH